ncbi:hypothetical protein BH23CHL2_BH23CHL2_14740 [soil metagenome]
MAETIDKTSYDYELPQHMIDAIEEGVLSREQLRELIEIEAAVLGLTFEEAEEQARAGKLPKHGLGTSIETFLWMYRKSEAQER